MEVLRGRNVSELFPLGLDLLAQHGRREKSRNGPVIVAPWPVVSVYENPKERVLMSPTRDANPFFHLFECLWMLAGRNDTTSLDHYVRDFGARFGESDGTMHGAYGYRWRKSMGIDQIDVVVQKLRANPNDRQCVIQMWGSEEIGCDDLLGDWNDRPCNTHVYLRVRDLNTHDRISSSDENVLDLTVLCRSNDIVMGAYGANAVHFSFLQEYLAGRIGVGVGTMYQVSNNWHAYVKDLDRLGDPVLLMDEWHDEELTGHYSSQTVPVGDDFEKWDEDLGIFMRWHDDICSGNMRGETYTNDWFATVATPVCASNWYRRRGEWEMAARCANNVRAPDWRVAAISWIRRHQEIAS